MYKVYNISSNALVFTCQSRIDLIKWFSKFNSIYTRNNNSMFSRIAMNPNDIYGYEDFYVRRSIMVYDEYNRIIDPRSFKEEIYISHPYVKTIGKRYTYIYRYDPVPRTGMGRRNFRAKRNISTTQERRKACEHDIVSFLRPSRNIKNLPNTSSWDDIERKTSRSWKDIRKEKQWM